MCVCAIAISQWQAVSSSDGDAKWCTVAAFTCPASRPTLGKWGIWDLAARTISRIYRISSLLNTTNRQLAHHNVCAYTCTANVEEVEENAARNQKTTLQWKCLGECMCECLVSCTLLYIVHLLLLLLFSQMISGAMLAGGDGAHWMWWSCQTRTALCAMERWQSRRDC